MITFMFSFGLFTCGIIAACIDWNNFMNYFFRFDPIIEVQYPKNATYSTDGNQTMDPQNFAVIEHHFNPRIILYIFIGLIALFFVMIYLPAKILFEYMEDKYTPIIAKFGLKQITYRKEIKRRGSWPLAYSNEFANF